MDLAIRYIPDRKLPDKAIDLIDEAAASVKMSISSKPVELDKLEKEIRSLEIEKEATNEKKRIEEINTLLSSKKSEYDALFTRWKKEKESIESMKTLKMEIESLTQKAIEYERTSEYGKVAQIRYGDIPAKQKLLEELEIAHSNTEESSFLRERVDAEEVASVIAKWTGIPVGKLIETESEKYLHLREMLATQVIGQDEAVRKVSEAIQRNKAGLSDPHRPIASFLFLGPTGVGKTETAKALARTLWNDERAYIRIDMSEYMESHSVARLIGAPPGYIGHDEWGQLTEAVRRHPYSILLLDEVEKAHPNVWNIFLQVLDDGQLTDGKWRQVNFSNTIIIMTSNLGSEYLLATDANASEKVQQIVRSHFRPEFLNRLDDIITFQPLSSEVIHTITRMQMESVSRLLMARHIMIHYESSLIDRIAKLGYDPQYGARPLRRTIRDMIMNPLSQKILSGEILEWNSYILTLDASDMLRVERKQEI